MISAAVEISEVVTLTPPVSCTFSQVPINNDVTLVALSERKTPEIVILCSQSDQGLTLPVNPRTVNLYFTNLKNLMCRVVWEKSPTETPVHIFNFVVYLA